MTEELIELIQKHHPDALSGDAAAVGSVMRELNAALATVIASVWLHKGSKIASTLLDFHGQKLVESVNAIMNETLRQVSKQ